MQVRPGFSGRCGAGGGVLLRWSEVGVAWGQLKTWQRVGQDAKLDVFVGVGGIVGRRLGRAVHGEAWGTPRWEGSIARESARCEGLISITQERESDGGCSNEREVEPRCADAVCWV
jgi:hypothetical protein